MRSFANPTTFFEVVVSDTPPTVDGFSIGEPTGEIRCLECSAQHLNIDEIPHAADCSQRFTHSRWYFQAMCDE